MPVQAGMNEIKNNVDNQFRVLIFWKSGEARIKDLERRNLELAASCAQFGELKRENAGLRKQLEIPMPRAEKVILANVIGKDDFLILDRGENDGVEIGSVVVKENFLVGTVIKVTPRRAYVMLPTSSESKVPVKAGQARGVVAGQFGTAMALEQINQNENIDFADYILTSGEGSVSIPNLIVGKVGKLRSRDSDIFKTAEVTLILEFSKLEQVFVWR